MSVFLKIKLFYPKIIAILLVILSFIPLGIPGAKTFFPLVDLMVIYYWCVYRPELMPNWFVFLMGLTQDAITGFPFGFNALNNLLFRSTTMFLKDKYSKESFVVVWQGFALMAASFMVFKYGLFALVTGAMAPIGVIFVQLLISIALYPVFHSLFNFIITTLPEQPADA